MIHQNKSQKCNYNTKNKQFGKPHTHTACFQIYFKQRHSPFFELCLDLLALFLSSGKYSKKLVKTMWVFCWFLQLTLGIKNCLNHNCFKTLILTIVKWNKSYQIAVYSVIRYYIHSYSIINDLMAVNCYI